MIAFNWVSVLESCSWALIHFVWQGCVIAGLAATGLFVLRNRRPAARYAWALLCLSIVAATPVTHFAMLQRQMDSVVAAPAKTSIPSSALQTLRATSAGAKPLARVTELRSKIEWPRLFHMTVFVVWLLGQLAVCLRICISAHFLWQVNRFARPVEAELCQRAAVLAQRLKIACPRINTSHLATGAFAAGFLRRVVVIPAAWLNEMTPEMLDAVIAHELAHLRRHDLWVNLFQRIVETVLFIHPAVWWLSQKIRHERELCCDELAIDVTREKGLYAKTLEHVARRTVVGPGILATQMGDDRMSLLRRVRFVLGETTSATSTGWWPAGLLAMLIPCGLLWVGQTATSAADEEDVRAPTRVTSPANLIPEQHLAVPGAVAAQGPSTPFTWTLDEYIIEPPDIVLINGIELRPKSPFEIQRGDVIGVEVTEPPPGWPFGGPMLVEASGVVNFGPGYGSVPVAGLTTGEAAARIRRHLERQRKDTGFKVEVSIHRSSLGQTVTGEHLVGPDGTINLGLHGRLYISGMTISKAAAAIEAHLARSFEKPKIALDVMVSNSKFFYVIQRVGPEDGDEVTRIPVTGKETVLDALSMVGGLQDLTSWRIHLRRPTKSGKDQVLPVNLEAITRKGDTSTNYQLLPGDRLFILPNEQDASDEAPRRATLSSQPSIPIMGPLTSGGKAQVLDPPTDDEVLSIIQVGSPNSPLLLPKNRRQLRFEKTLVADYVDPPKEYALIGRAQLHHAHYKCTVTLPSETNRAFLNRAEAHESTFFIDHTHLHAGDDIEVTDRDRRIAEEFSELQEVDTPVELYTKAYYVADLVVPLKAPTFSPSGVREQDDGAEADFDTLINLITSTVEPNSWDSIGGDCQIVPFEGNLSLVVTQTANGHEGVLGLLKQLRGLQEVKVVLKSRKLGVSSSLLRRLGLFGKSIATLTVEEQRGLLEAARRDPASRTYAELKATLLNGELVAIEVPSRDSGGALEQFKLQAVVGSDDTVRATIEGPEGGEFESTMLRRGEAILITGNRSIPAARGSVSQVVQLLSAEIESSPQSNDVSKGSTSPSFHNGLHR